MLDDDSRSSSGIKRTPTNHPLFQRLINVEEWGKAYCVSGGTKLSCYDKKDIWRIKKFPLPCSGWLQFQQKHRTSSVRGEYVLVNNLLKERKMVVGEGDCKIEEKK
jgi:hypothetical protein